MKRRFDPAMLELMDRPQPVTTELERDLQNLRQLNLWFGSYRLISLFLQRWIKSGEHLRVVDLCTGSGDIPRLIANHARKVDAHVTIDAVDQQSATLEIAKRLSADYQNIHFIEANVLNWKPDQRYDVTLCTLALHHFSDDDAVRVLQRCRELSRKFILVSDLRRGLFGTVGVYLLTATLFREPMTKFDGRLSMARAFSFCELRDLALRAGWRNFGHKAFRYARQAIWLEMA
jgi:SAM-dependent methyltransferase